MTHAELQQALKDLGTYQGEIDGQFGPASRAAFISALLSGPDTPITDQDITIAAGLLGCPQSAIRAVWKVEAAGAGFVDGLAKILPEPHIFSKLTGHRFDADYPTLSYPVWDRSKYPGLQTSRYDQLARMVSLDVDAALEATSYGAFQILGENYDACGFDTPWHMVHQLSLTEGDQLQAFIRFVSSKRLDSALRHGDWATFARGYNGTAYAVNHYDTRLAQAAAASA